MASDVFKCFLPSFEVCDLLSVSHRFIRPLSIHMTEQVCGTSVPTCFDIEVSTPIFLCDASPVTDEVCGMVSSEVIRDTRLTPDKTGWLATGTFGNCVSFEVRSVLHCACSNLANMCTCLQLLLLSLSEGESLCVHILHDYRVYEENRTGGFYLYGFRGLDHKGSFILRE
jgi:hypothetical protein